MSRLLKIFFLLLLCMANPSANAVDVLPKGTSRTLPVNESAGFVVDVTAAPKSNRQMEGEGNARWGVEWTDSLGNRYALTLGWGNKNFGTFNDERFMTLTLSAGATILANERLIDDVDLYKGRNTLKLSVADDGMLRWNVGATRLEGAVSHMLPALPSAGSVRLFTQGSNLDIFHIGVSEVPTAPRAMQTIYNTPDHFVPAADKVNSAEGIWVYLDRDNDPRWARPGGRYTLGIRKSDDTEEILDIIYLGGAVTNASRWMPGMRKGRLAPTPFTGHYHMEWTDAMFNGMDMADECSASLNDDGSILTLSFPLDRSTLRFYREK